MLLGRRRALAGNGSSIRLRVFGPAPQSIVDVAGIDSAQTRTLTRPSNIRWGEKYTLKFSGECGQLQQWRGLSQGGGTIPTLRFNRALPTTQPPAGSGRNLAFSMLARNGMVRA